MQQPEAFVNLIADATRRRVLTLLAGAEAGLTVDDVAQAAGVHRTVAASHLQRLAGAGLVDVTDERGGRGRPRRRYRATEAAEVAVPARRHRELAEVLASALTALGEPGHAAATEAGRAFGRRLGALARLGARYERAPAGELVATPCVFREACRDAGPIVCRAHAAIIEGALGEPCRPLGPRPGGCAFELG